VFPVSDVHTEFAALAEEAIREVLSRNPAMATHMGIHDYDDQLRDHSPEAQQAERQALAALIRRAGAIRSTDLNADERVDLELLQVMLEDSRQSLEVGEPQLHRPDHYVSDLLGGAYLLMSRDFAPAGRRAESLLARLRQVPRVLRQAQANLREVHPVIREVATAECRGGIGLFTGMLPAFAAQVPALEAKLNEAGNQAAGALEAFAQFLETELKDRGICDFALGRERFDWRLKHYYQIPYDAETLYETGLELVRQTQREMAELARVIDPNATWQEILERAKRERPSAGELVEAYRTMTAQARQFIIDREIVPLPPDEELVVEETPPFLRPGMAFAAYSMPGPFEAKPQGFFWVTPIDQSAPAEQQERQLAAHYWPWMKIIVLHEAYPGHHVQICWSHRHPSRVRRFAFNILFAEGWTMWCEQMMEEQGWLATPVEKLTRLNAQLWRCCRIVLDTALHTRGMTPAEAIEYLQTTAGLPKAAAATEVTGYYCREATVPMSYMMGKQEVLRLLKDCRDQRGAAFRLNEFHRELLSHGTIPFRYIRSAMLGER
jgi:uncharacterized protein (DUF885 family)